MRPIDAEKIPYSFDVVPNADPRKSYFKATADKRDIDKLPTISPDEVRGVGEWIGEGDGYADGFMVYDMWSCSCCGEYFGEWDDRPKWKFCPNCGARMKGADE